MGLGQFDARFAKADVVVNQTDLSNRSIHMRDT